MVGVIRRGGRLSVFDFDWETQIVDSPYTETTRLITRSFCDSFKNGWIGRRLPRLFKQHAMTGVRVFRSTVSTVSHQCLHHPAVRERGYISSSLSRRAFRQFQQCSNVASGCLTHIASTQGASSALTANAAAGMGVIL
jgi:hypothetical protein